MRACRRRQSRKTEIAGVNPGAAPLDGQQPEDRRDGARTCRWQPIPTVILSACQDMEMTLNLDADMTQRRPAISRRAMLGLAGVACASTVVGGASASRASEARIVSITVRDSLPVMRPDTPVPHDPAQLFHFQLSTTRNTVVYAARFDANGLLATDDPVSIYWRRYQSDGSTRPLNLAERMFAYSLDFRPVTSAGVFGFTFRAVPSFPLELRQIAPFRAGFFGRHDGREMQLIYGYLTVINGLIPQVPALRMFGSLSGGGYGDVVLVPRG